MEQNEARELDIRDAASIAFGLLSSRATSNVDRKQNRAQAMKIIWGAIKGSGVPVPTEERLQQAPDKKKGPPQFGTIAVDLDGSIDGRCGYLTIHIDEVVDSLLEQAKNRRARAKSSGNVTLANEAEMLTQAVMLIRRAY